MTAQIAPGSILSYLIFGQTWRRLVVEKLSITLPSEMIDAIKSRVEAGSHASTSEVIREAMRTWLRLEEEHQERIEGLRARIRHSLEDSART